MFPFELLRESKSESKIMEEGEEEKRIPFLPFPPPIFFAFVPTFSTNETLSKYTRLNPECQRFLAHQQRKRKEQSAELLIDDHFLAARQLAPLAPTVGTKEVHTRFEVKPRNRTRDLWQRRLHSNQLCQSLLLY